MKVKNIATMKVEFVNPETTVSEIVRTMKESDIGFVPVVDQRGVIGVITDRDLALRCLGDQPLSASSHAKDVMTPHVYGVHMNADLEEAAWIMVNDQVRRLVVLNDSRSPVGVISIDDLAMFGQGDDTAGRVLRNILHDRRPVMAETGYVR